MLASYYWDHDQNRKYRKLICNGSILFREILEINWVIYGLILYNSAEAETCENEENGIYMWCMWVFLALGVCKLVLFGVLIALASFIYGRGLMRK